MDVTKLLESEFIGVQFIKDSPTKKGIILSAGTQEPSKDGKYMSLQVLIEIDGKRKNWKMNKTSLINLAKAWSSNTDSWVGKQVFFTTMLMQGGKEGIVGQPA